MEMKQFEKTIAVGTKVLLVCGNWATVKEIHDTGKWIKVKEFEGSFQRGHVLKYTNKAPNSKELMEKRIKIANAT